MKNVGDRLFTIAKKLNIKLIEQIHTGISNFNYNLADKYHLKLSYDERFALTTNFDFINKLAELQITAKIYPEHSNSDTQVSEYLPFYRPLNPKKDIKACVDIIKQLHSIPTKEKNVTLKSLISKYQEMFSVAYPQIDLSGLDKIERNVVPVPLHFDLLFHNFYVTQINNEEKIILLDFDLMTYGDPYLDLVSILSENKVSRRISKQIVNLYFDDDEKEIGDFLVYYKSIKPYFDYLWALWALLRLEKTPDSLKKTYQKIYKQKIKYLKKLFL